MKRGASSARRHAFNCKSLRRNAVVRWEYRAGSAFFLAWTQDRSDLAQHFGDFALGPSFDRPVSAGLRVARGRAERPGISG